VAKDHDWSPQQVAAIKAVEEWYREPNAPQIFRLFGYAGTGKTTLAKHIASIVRKVAKEGDEESGKVVFGAFTGKAALVLRSKGCHGASTIHGMIYTLDEESGGVPRFILNEDGSPLKDAKLCIIDECSMVGAELAHDLLSFGVKVLVLGDPAQLPPVQDAGFFTEANPDVMLTEVHRQAEGNPIIRMSMDIRNGKRLDYGDFGACRVVTRGHHDLQAAVLGADQILVGLNRTRTAYNGRVRELRGIKSEYPKVGEKLVCLKNDRSRYLFNGGLWSVAKLRKANPVSVNMVLKPEDAGGVERSVDVKVHPFFFEGREGELTWEQLKDFQQFTYGYALTVHKSQGSQWNNVVLFDESGVFREDRERWLYTGVTRAAEKLTVVMS
jgi:exodeoxyribonuclease-5